MGKKKRFGCLQLRCNVKDYQKLVKKIVSQEDIYDQPGYGYQIIPHITLLYGFIPEKTETGQLKQYLYSTKHLYIYTKQIDYFQQKQFDVVKFNIKSKSVRIMNSRLTGNFQYQNIYPSYSPHMTIAYVKSGLGKKYAKKLQKKYRIHGSKYVYGVFGQGQQDIEDKR